MPQYHVTLGSQGLVLDLQSYARTLADPFVGKVASGARTYDDLVHDQVIAINDWSGGEGYLRHDPDRPERHRSALGADGLSEIGALRLGPFVAEVSQNPNSDARPQPMIAALGKLFWGYHGGNVLAYDGSTVTLPFTLGAGTGNAASFAEFQNNLYIGKSGSGQIARWNGSALTDPFLTLPSPVTACHSMGVFYRGPVGYLYFAGDAPDGVRIYYTDGVSLSTLRYQLNEPSIRVEPQVLGQIATFFGVSLSGSARTGVYSLVDSGGSERWAYETTLSDRALTSGSVLSKYAYLGSYGGGEIYRWDGASLERIFATLAQPYGNSLLGSTAGLGSLWLGIAGGASGADGTGLKRFNGDAWAEAVPLNTAYPGLVQSMAVYNGDVYAAVHRQTGTPGWWLLRIYSGQYAASATLESGLIDGRLPGIAKVWRSLELSHSALTAGQSLQVQYRLDDAGAWTLLGTSNSSGATSATFNFPSATVAKLVALRVVLAGPAGSSTSVRLYGLELRCVPRPDVKREWQFDCLLEGTAQTPLVLLDGSSASQTGQQVSAALWGLAAQSGPLTFIDLDGASRNAWLLEFRETVAKQSQRLGTHLRGRVRLLEA